MNDCANNINIDKTDRHTASQLVKLKVEKLESFDEYFSRVVKNNRNNLTIFQTKTIINVLAKIELLQLLAKDMTTRLEAS